MKDMYASKTSNLGDGIILNVSMDIVRIAGLGGKSRRSKMDGEMG